MKRLSAILALPMLLYGGMANAQGYYYSGGNCGPGDSAGCVAPIPGTGRQPPRLSAPPPPPPPMDGYYLALAPPPPVYVQPAPPVYVQQAPQVIIQQQAPVIIQGPPPPPIVVPAPMPPLVYYPAPPPFCFIFCSGPVVPDGRGGFVPWNNSRYDPFTGNFLN